LLGRKNRSNRYPSAFTLIELLVVISIISLLMSILLPSLSRARDQAKGIHCLARLKEFGNALAAYENTSNGILPPARWYVSDQDLGRIDDNGRPRTGTDPSAPIEYGWAEILYSYVYGDSVRTADRYPVQRNIGGDDRWSEYFICKAVGDTEASSGHYRVYLPAWSARTYALERNGSWGVDSRPNPFHPAARDSIPPKLPLIGDANEYSERGDGLGNDDCSYIDASEADYAGSNGRNGNRFSDRHYGGTNYLFQDLHASWSTSLRGKLARDYDLNGVEDIVELRP